VKTGRQAGGMRPDRLRYKGQPVSRAATILVVVAVAAVTAGFAVFAVWSFSLIRGFPGDNEPRVSTLKPVQIIGSEETVFDYPARAFRDANGQVNLIAAHYVNRRFVGPSLNRLEHPCDVILRSGMSPDPAAYDDREWLAATYTRDGGTVYALVHDEYQGDKHRGRCQTGSYLRCWYNAITFSRSTDGGASFTQPAAPGALVASVPYRYKPDQGFYGIFEPSNIVRDERDGYYYVMVHAQRYKRQQQGTCLMRTRRLDQPGSWRAWDGDGWGVRFADPYRGDVSASDSNLCAPVAYQEIGDMSQSLTYNTYLEKYMLVSPSALRDPKTGSVVNGIYYSLSDDLIHWEPRKLIRESELLQTYRCGDRRPIYYPSVLDPRSSSRNFETVGRTAYLYFTRFNPTSCQLALNRDLVRVRVRFSK
jgi:hypothetical protein